ncbi:MAG TPA: lysylphosphatidylglycerol synthase transmembrane domain-containing protein [Pyrinomonadaceae bacterium]|nr:lysylphosphatidylglycerol synthase transmembrane domain-containing protein [Pyrinomonadaceae bacterium]
MKTQRYRKYVEFVALCLLAAALLWWFGRNLDWREVGHRVSSANPYLLTIAVLIICFAYLIRAFRWGALLKPLGAARLKDLFVATTVGFSAVFLIGRAGEVVRPVVLPMRDRRVRPSAALVTIVVERIYDMTAVALMFAVNLIWFRPLVTLDVSFGRVRMVGFGMLVATILGIVFLTWYRTNSAWLIDVLDRRVLRWRFIPRRLAQLVMRILEQLSQALRVLVNARELAETIGWTAALWIGVAVANLLVMHAFGLRVGITETVFVLGWSLVGSLVPTPGGAAGAFHAATAAGFLFLGVEKELAAAVSIVLHLVDFGPAVLFGVFYLIRGDLSISGLRSLVSPATDKEDFENSVGEVQLR